MKGMIFMSPNNGKNIIDLNAVRAHKKMIEKYNLHLKLVVEVLSNQ